VGKRVHEDEQDYVQALCRRIAFAATRKTDNEEGEEQAFESFQTKNEGCVIDPTDILKWLGDARVVLLIDDLDNLAEIGDPRSEKTANFEAFIMTSFLNYVGHFLVFTSQYSSALTSTKFLKDELKVPHYPSVLQLAQNDVSIPNRHMIVYFGGMPGLISDWWADKQLGRHLYNDGSAAKAINAYNMLAQRGDSAGMFKNMLATVVTGDIKVLPKSLRNLVVFEPEARGFRWTLFHLQFVLENANIERSPLGGLRSKMAQLCDRIYRSDKYSSDFEELFILMLLIRSITNKPDGHFLPKHWFDDNPKTVYNPYLPSTYGRPKDFEECTTFDELVEGIKRFDFGVGPCVAIVYPQHYYFDSYNAFAMKLYDGKIEEIRGFQVREGDKKPDPESRPHSGMVSFWMSDVSPYEQVITESGWIVSPHARIKPFFGKCIWWKDGMTPIM
jgi:hypothetical protein